jgi:hypothetical protein
VRSDESCDDGRSDAGADRTSDGVGADSLTGLIGWNTLDDRVGCRRQSEADASTSQNTGGDDLPKSTTIARTVGSKNKPASETVLPNPYPTAEGS